ncbi:hypothetical protein G7Y89_g446 [Cudoniella acicularis]|uniref:TRUD domain-containing protein n=1 Tax=Cudoniella acicularis TaxID=354080 RepID=A0A8H4RYS0_9HELO|nr:hypothetical protein G7Y89_g446 [Cudoniella acicularis]
MASPPSFDRGAHPLDSDAAVNSEPPLKKQKILSSQSSIAIKIEKGSNSKSKMCDTISVLEPNITNTESREAQVGIEGIVSSSNEGFGGILKQRYTDFIVNEIDSQGRVVQLTNDNAPVNKPAAKQPPSTPVVKTENVEDSAFPSSAAAEAAQKVVAATSHSLPEIKSKIAGSTTLVKIEEPIKTPVDSVEDRQTLIKYFGSILTDEIYNFHKNVISKPGAKPAFFGNLFSEPISDRTLRGEIHRDMRRIFDGRLETEAVNGKIMITAARYSSKVANQNGNARQPNPRAQNQNQNQNRGRIGWEELGGQYLHFTLYKENKDTMEVVSSLARSLKVKPRDFNFAGTKDRRAITTQRMSVYRQKAPDMAKLNNNMMRNVRIGNFKHEKHSLELGELEGNQFIITLRDCHFPGEAGLNEGQRLELGNRIVGNSIEQLQANGFLNYFGLQRFGTFGVGTDEIGKKILQGDFEGAVWDILSYTQDSLEAALNPEAYLSSEDQINRDDIDRAHAIWAWKTTGKMTTVVEMLPRRFSAENALVRKFALDKAPLLRKPDFLGGLLQIPRNLRTMYVHAYQSLVWNKVVTERWKRHGFNIVQGDLVLLETPAASAAKIKDEYDENGEIVVHPSVGDTALTQDDVFQRARALTAKEARSGEYSIYDIVLPLPGFDVDYPQNDIGDFYKEFMGSDAGGGLDPANMRRPQKDFSLSGGYRKMMAQIGQDATFELKSYVEDTKQLVETDLERLEMARPKQSQNNNSFPPSGLKNERGQQSNDSSNPPNGFRNGRWQQPNNHRQGRAFARSAETQVMKDKYVGSAAHTAWLAAPGQIAAQDKAAAAAYDKKKTEGPINPDDIQQPPIKDKFIETSAEDGRRTGNKSIVTHNVEGESKEPAHDIKKEAAVEKPSNIIYPMEPPPATPLIDRLSPNQSNPMNKLHPRGHSVSNSFSSSSDSSEGGVLLIPELAPQASAQASPKPLSRSATSDLSELDPEFTALNPQLPASPVARGPSSDFVLAPELSTLVEQGNLLKRDIDEISKIKTPKIAVIVKFSLGSSQYATMALRELMKAGGVKTYKPDFSSVR